MTIATTQPPAWQPLLRRAADAAAARGIAFAVVIGLHALAGLGLLAHRVAVEPSERPMLVQLLEIPQVHEAPPQPPAPRIERPVLPPALMPELNFAPAPTAITVTPDPPPVPARPPSEPAQDPIIEARFDVDYLDNPQPVYPPMSRRLREEGLVVLKVRVRADGTPDGVFVHRHSGSERLDAAALAAVKRWRFVPAKRGDRAVDSWVLVPIEFGLRA